MIELNVTFGGNNISGEFIEGHPRVQLGGGGAAAAAAAVVVVVVVVVVALVVGVGGVVELGCCCRFILERIGFDEDVVLALVVVPELSGVALEADAKLHPVHRGAGRNRNLERESVEEADGLLAGSALQSARSERGQKVPEGYPVVECYPHRHLFRKRQILDLIHFS